jgi:hypothetical protein
LSLSEPPVAPVDLGSIFSGTVFCGEGIFGSLGCGCTGAPCARPAVAKQTDRTTAAAFLRIV